MLKTKSPLVRSCSIFTTTSVLLFAISSLSITQAAACKIPKTFYKNVSCVGSSGYFLAIKDFGEPVALIDNKGKIVTSLSSYQKADGSTFSEGLLPVLSKGRVGYVDIQGREVIPTIYDMLSNGKDWARPVSDGRIVVKKEGQFGVISISNQVVVPFSNVVTGIDNYSNGRARVRKNKAVSWVDKNGNPIVETTTTPKGAPKNTASIPVNQDKRYANEESSNEGYADARNSVLSAKEKQNVPTSVTISTPAATPMPNPIIIDESNLLSSHQAPQVLPPLPLLSGFTSLQPQQQDGKWGFVDDNNVVMITYSFDEVRPFSEGLAGVRIDNEWGFLNLGGQLVIPFGFKNDTIMTNKGVPDASSFVFKEGRAWVNSLANGIKMCIDKDGEYVGCD